MSQGIARILLVEDNDSHVSLICRGFKQRSEQFDVTVAQTALEAKARLAESSPDLVLADLRLPDGDGIDLLSKDNGPGPFPFVLMTSHGNEEAAVAAMKAGALDYIVKTPETMFDMPHIVERALREWNLIAERRQVEEHLRLLSSAVEQSSEGLVVVDMEDRVLFANQAFAAMHGYAPEDLPGQHMSIFHAPEQMPAVELVKQETRETGAFSGELWHARRDGSVFPTLMHNSMLRDESGEPIGAIGTARDITDIKQGEEALRRARDGLEQRVKERTAELAGANAALSRRIEEKEKAERALHREQHLLRELLELQERERKLVAYEIHDGLAQQLTGAIFQFQAFDQHRDKSADQGPSAFDLGLDLLRESIAEARRLIGGLRPPILDESGIVAAIDYLICEVRQREGLEIDFVHDIATERLAPPLETAVFRIVQEALTNACRHSQTDRVRVELRGRNGNVLLAVRDWGIGFDPSTVEKNRFGLEGIRERVRLLNGLLTIDTAPQRGTRIEVELPLVRKKPASAI